MIRNGFFCNLNLSFIIAQSLMVRNSYPDMVHSGGFSRDVVAGFLQPSSRCWYRKKRNTARIKRVDALKEVHLLHTGLKIIQPAFGVDVRGTQITMAQDVRQSDEIVIILLKIIVGGGVPQDMGCH